MNRTQLAEAVEKLRPQHQRPATPEQLAQIKALINELDGDIAEAVYNSVLATNPTQRDAESRLTSLGLRKRVLDMAMAAARRAHPDDEEHIPLGYHQLDGAVYRVRRSTFTGLRSVEILDLIVHRYVSAPREVLERLDAHTLMDRASAQAAGRRWGLCVRCASPLEGPSAEAGMGPTCAKRWDQ